MPTDKRRAAARRRAWGRGPMILRFEPLEGRQLLSATPLPDLVGAAFDTAHNLDWGDSFHAKGVILNQGSAAVTTPFRVNIYASSTPALNANSVLLGQVTIPAGLQPGSQVPFDQVVSLPANALSGVSSSGSIYIDTLIDPDGLVNESNRLNNAGNGQGYDTSMVTISPHLPVALTGGSLGVYPDQASWGQTVRVTAQVHNDAPGDAPPTRARVVLTPMGQSPGGPYDVTIGNLSVPAVAGNQTTAVTADVPLPVQPPAALLGSTQFILSVVQDADFQTNPLSPHRATQGTGIDMVPMTIALPSNYSALLRAPRPDLAAVQVLTPSQTLTFGQPFQVTTTVQNQGNLDAGPYRVRYLLVGTDGSMENALFLADTTLQGLKAGYGQDVVQTLQLPSKLPTNVTLNTAGLARIAVVIDPEYAVDEANKSNNVVISNPLTLKVIGTDGRTVVPTVPQTTTTTTPSPLRSTGTTPLPVTPTPAANPTTPAGRKALAAAQLAAAKQAAAARKAGASGWKATTPTSNSLSHKLKVFPNKVSHEVKKLFGMG